MDDQPRSRGQTEDPLLHVTELMLPPLSARIGLLCCGVVVIFSTTLAGQTPSHQSGEYNIGGANLGDQDFPAVSLNASGGYLVWEDNHVDGNNGHGVAALRLDATLTATGSVFRVNQQLAGDQGRPHVLLLGNGSTLF